MITRGIEQSAGHAPALGAWPLCCALVLLVAGCAAPPIEDPARLALDPEASASRRQAAVDLLIATAAAGDEAAVAALHDVLWSDRQPVELRLAALDALVRRDVAAFVAVARRRVEGVDQWNLLGPLLARGAEERWPGWATVVIRSWSRPSQVYADADRPERSALAALAPGGTVEAAVYAFVAGRWGEGALGDRVAAWELLTRITGEPQRRAWLLKEPGGDLLMTSLRDAARSLGELPATRQQLLWLLATPDLPEPGGDEADRPALRHLPVIAGEPRSRDELLAEVARRLATSAHAGRTRGGMMQAAPPDESLAEHAPGLSRGDLVVIDRLLDLLGEPGVVAQLFAQADADHADTQSEHGGVLRFAADGRGEALAFAPMTRVHDHVYIPPATLITTLYGGLAHYHFHAQDHDNAAYAGPGAGDHAFARRFGAACVVFTFLDRDTLNADYYQPGGVVIDLGTLRRP